MSSDPALTPRAAAPTAPTAAEPPARTDFLRAIVAADQASGKYGGRVLTRFPPEPNGYPHIGHSKSILLNFGLAAEFGGRCNLRFDDTNPETEDMEYVEAMIRDIRWLGVDPGEHVYFASDYYEALYDYAIRLIELGRAYVCPLNDEEIRAWRGTVNEPGRPSPGRDRSIAENLDLFRRMRAGEFPDGAYTLRARIDMAAANMKLRDPLLYRIRHATHYRRGDAWCIYPMYDYAHPLSDAIERITHSICTLEFENNRDIYDWLLDTLEIPERPYQHEFARLSLNWCVMSKRKLLQLVEEGLVDGWEDPRMPTLSGMRRRGYTPSAIRAFCDKIGIAKANSTVDYALLEECVRDDLNPTAPRALCVLRPLKVVLTNAPAPEQVEAPRYPHDVPVAGTRPLPFSSVLYIDQEDFREAPPPGWHRLAPGAEVRLRHAYVIRCDEVVKDPATGAVVELRCTSFPETRSTDAGERGAPRKVKGTIHWVDAERSLSCEVRLYDRLFAVERPGEGTNADGTPRDFKLDLNPHSLTVLTDARIEPAVAHDPADTRYQFERLGYFCRDTTSTPDHLVFNRTVHLKDAWARQEHTARADTAPRAEPSAPRPAATPVGPAIPQLTGDAAALRDTLMAAHGLDLADAARLAADPALTALFQAALPGHAGVLARLLVNDVARMRKERPESDLDAGALRRVVALLATDRLTTGAARALLADLATPGANTDALLTAATSGATVDIGGAVTEVVAAHPAEVAQYRAGKTRMLGFFVGKVMKATGGRARPDQIEAALRAALEV